MRKAEKRAEKADWRVTMSHAKRHAFVVEERQAAAA